MGIAACNNCGIGPNVSENIYERRYFTWLYWNNGMDCSQEKTASKICNCKMA